MHASDESAYNRRIISIQNFTFIFYREINESEDILKLMSCSIYNNIIIVYLIFFKR